MLLYCTEYTVMTKKELDNVCTFVHLYICTFVHFYIFTFVHLYICTLYCVLCDICKTRGFLSRIYKISFNGEINKFLACPTCTDRKNRRNLNFHVYLLIWWSESHISLKCQQYIYDFPSTPSAKIH